MNWTQVISRLLKIRNCNFWLSAHKSMKCFRVLIRRNFVCLCKYFGVVTFYVNFYSLLFVVLTNLFLSFNFIFLLKVWTTKNLWLLKLQKKNQANKMKLTWLLVSMFQYGSIWDVHAKVIIKNVPLSTNTDKTPITKKFIQHIIRCFLLFSL